MEQLTLPVALPVYSTFDTFINKGNEELVQNCLNLASGHEHGSMTFVSGLESTGKTHLLQAMCHKSNELNSDHSGQPHTGQSVYIDLATDGFTPDVLQGWEHVSLIALDNVDKVIHDSSWQESLFDCYNQRLSRNDENKANLVVSSHFTLSELAISLKDLASRFSSGYIYQLQRLPDDLLADVFSVHSKQRGLEVSGEVREFLLRRMPRDLKLLVAIIDQLDAYSLQTKRRITIPLIKELLENNPSFEI